MSKAIIRVDGLRTACQVHLGLLCVLAVATAFTVVKCKNCLLLALLWAQEIVAFFSALYIYARAKPLCGLSKSAPQVSPEYHYSMKWTEYAVSATLGALIIYVSGNPSSQAWPALLLIFLSTVQQQLGYILDRDSSDLVKFSGNRTVCKWQTVAQFVFAWGIQLAEFLVVAYEGAPKVSLFVVYVLLWSSFGVLCGIRLWHLTKYTVETAQRYWAANRWGSELAYTTLGWSAKGAIVITALPYVYSNSATSDAISAVLVGLTVIASIVAIRRTRRQVGTLYETLPDSDESEDDADATGILGAHILDEDFADH